MVVDPCRPAEREPGELAAIIARLDRTNARRRDHLAALYPLGTPPGDPFVAAVVRAMEAVERSVQAMQSSGGEPASG